MLGLFYNRTWEKSSASFRYKPAENDSLRAGMTKPLSTSFLSAITLDGGVFFFALQ